MEEIMNQINQRPRGEVAVMVASHNEDTVRFTVQKLVQYHVYISHYEGIHQLLWRSTSVIMKVYISYCEGMHQLLWMYASVIVKVYISFCEGLHQLLWRYASVILKVYISYCEGMHQLLWRYTSVFVKVYISYCEGLHQFCEGIVFVKEEDIYILQACYLMPIWLINMFNISN